MIILNCYHVDSFGELSEYNKGVVGGGRSLLFRFLLKCSG